MSEQATQDTAAKAAPERDYLVYEVDEANTGTDKKATVLMFVTKTTARTEKDARWQAIDGTVGLKARATPQDGKEAEGVNLVAIAARYVGEPVMTREELDVRTVRR